MKTDREQTLTTGRFRSVIPLQSAAPENNVPCAKIVLRPTSIIRSSIVIILMPRFLQYVLAFSERKRLI